MVIYSDVVQGSAKPSPNLAELGELYFCWNQIIVSPAHHIADNIETTKLHEIIVFISKLRNYKQIMLTFVFMKILLLKLSQNITQ